MTIKLYGSGRSRWVRPYWTLQELGVPFEAVSVSTRKGENRTPAFLAINPFGKTPVLTDGTLRLTESSAICAYLADQYPDGGLGAKAGTVERAEIDQWMSFVVSDLEQPLWRMARHRYLYPEAQRSPADIELANADFHDLAAATESVIRDHLVGGRFSIADIAMAYALQWADGGGLLAGYPRLQSYRLHHVERPAFPRHLYP
jgi:glutathione S-transferase